MPEFGLIGYPLVHSFSKKYFTKKFEKENLTGNSYKLFPIDHIGMLPDVIKSHPRLWGLNVTIPYKVSVIPFLDIINPVALETGAVNTIQITEISGKKILTGYNTDVIGFERSLKQFIGNEKPSALILGTGGASKAVAYVLNRLNLPFLSVSRHPMGNKSIDYKQIDKSVCDTFRLIINTTPVGTYPNSDAFPPIPYKYLTTSHYLFDLVYNPSKTMFLQLGEEQNCMVINGIQMLEIQADESYKIWLNR